jgi:hypothetical protein
MKSAVSDLYCDVAYLSSFWVYSYDGHYTKALKTQDYCASGWPTLISEKIKAEDDSLLTNHPSQNFY